MARNETTSFGALLRRYRLAAGLSQEVLAEHAGLSTDAVAALERGRRTAPRPATVTLLADALRLDPEDRAALIGAALPLAEHATPAIERAGGPAASAPATVPALPTGTLTFLLTDIEGSTAFWEQHPVAMQAAIIRHDALIDEILARYDGRQIKERGEGDSIFAVFTSPSAAVAAVCALQQALLAESWPKETPLRVRMGVHTGEADLRGIGYYGVTVNRTARIRSLGHGGQILLSRNTADLVGDELPQGVGLRLLGTHVLKGLQRPEEIFQVLHPGLPADFPPLQSPGMAATNLPAQPAGLIGREHEQEQVRALLQNAHLVTLTGAGGAGKTRLALQVAADLRVDFPDGVWLVELASLTDPSLVPPATTTVLGLREEPGRPLPATLTDYLHDKHLLLVLDNCEHLIAACAELAAALLRTCPKLRILATSREGLEVTGEHRYPVPSLPFPELDHLPSPDQLGGYPAVALFVTRARERRADFALTPRNARAVVQICARLDGIPLAIELAAARISALPVEAIAARLDDRFRLLTGGPRTALPRQQTLRSALDWSYDLLVEPEQVLLHRLAVFAGGWTLEAAEAVCTGDGVEDWEVLDLLGGLVNKSLVLAEEREGEARYRLLETVRQYGQEKLRTAGEAATADRHLAWYLGLAERAEPLLVGPEQGVWLSRLEIEHDNMRAALRWALEHGTRGESPIATHNPLADQPDAGGRPSPDATAADSSVPARQRAVHGLRLAASLWRFWYTHGHLAEGRRWLEDLLERAVGEGVAGAALRAKALRGAGVLATSQGDYASARVLCEQSLVLYQDLGDKQGMAVALNILGTVAVNQGDQRRAATLSEESLALHRELGATRGIAVALNNLGNVVLSQGDHARAAQLFAESLALNGELGDTRGTAIALTNLAEVARHQRDYGRATALCEESLTLARELGDTWGTAAALNTLGEVAFDQGDYARATRMYKECLALQEELGDTAGIAMVREHLAKVACAQDKHEQAIGHNSPS